MGVTDSWVFRPNKVPELQKSFQKAHNAGIPVHLLRQGEKRSVSLMLGLSAVVAGCAIYGLGSMALGVNKKA